jgi:hypothetical protein
MDYGERQERAEFLVKALREHPDRMWRDKTFAEMADEIENQTDDGRTLVVISGLVLAALLSNK